VTTGTAAEARAPGARRRTSPEVSTPQYERRRRLIPVALAVLLALTALASAAVGAVAISPGQVLAALAEPLGVRLPWAFSEQQAAVVWGIRLPRVALAALVGATLASAGGALQGMFRNPLADPGLIGVSSGASLAAVAVIVLGERLWGLVAGLSPGAITTIALPGAAFAGGLAATLLVLRLARVGTPADAGARSTAATMLLCGVAVNAIAGAGVGFLVYLANDQQLRDVTFWTLGSLGGATWRSVGVALPFCLAAVLGLPRLASALNLLLLGESEARHLGVRVERTKRLAMVLSALGVGAAVAFTGLIGFVGLVVPHLLRLAHGPDHRHLLRNAPLLGATLLLMADLVARTAAAPAELPIGVVTAALGGPFFLWLLLGQRRGEHA
jgi:iron complex transport system permease protein